MKHVMRFLPTAAMLYCLCAYAIGGSIRTTPPGESDGSMLPLREVRRTEMDASTADHVERRQHAIDSAVRKREEQIIARLGLSPDQMSRYQALLAQIKAERDAMMSQPAEHMARGLAINRVLHDGLKEIFTEAQYRKYKELWNADSDALGAVALDASPALSKPISKDHSEAGGFKP